MKGPFWETQHGIISLSVSWSMMMKQLQNGVVKLTDMTDGIMYFETIIINVRHLDGAEDEFQCKLSYCTTVELIMFARQHYSTISKLTKRDQLLRALATQMRKDLEQYLEA